MKKDHKKFIATPFTDAEYEEMYGKRVTPVGAVFKSANHYYLQRETDVLHVSNSETSSIINSLYVSSLNGNDHEASNIDEFKNAIKEAIYKLEIDSMWGK
jgi:hypothetical protein